MKFKTLLLATLAIFVMVACQKDVEKPVENTCCSKCDKCSKGEDCSECENCVNNEECPPIPEKVYDLPGLWIGEYKYINPSTSPKYGQHMLYALKPDGTLIAESTDRGNTYYGAGTWTVTSDSLVKCTILYSSSDWNQPVEQIAEMVFSKKTGKMKGTYRTWGGDGTLEMSNIE